MSLAGIDGRVGLQPSVCHQDGQSHDKFWKLNAFPVNGLKVSWLKHVISSCVSDCMLASGTQDRGFEPSRSRRIFQGEKIHSMPSFGREVKLLVPCRRFTARKRPLNVTWKSGVSGKIHRPFLALIPSFTNRGLSCRLTWSASGDDGRN
jgi:hypothetical protein